MANYTTLYYHFLAHLNYNRIYLLSRHKHVRFDRKSKAQTPYKMVAMLIILLKQIFNFYSSIFVDSNALYYLSYDISFTFNIISIKIL